MGRIGGARAIGTAVLMALVVGWGCGGKQVTPLVTTAGKQVGSVYQRSGVAIACGAGDRNTTPDPAARFAAQSPTDQLYPFAGFELSVNPQCTNARLDAYRALAVFNMTPHAGLAGLVTKAELVVSVRALPSAKGTVVTFAAPQLNVPCRDVVGGAGALHRFGPAESGSLGLLVSSTGRMTDVSATSFPAGQLVYAFPASLQNADGSQMTTVAGATSPTSVGRTGLGGAIFTTDVTSQVNAALNGGIGAMAWMLTSSFEGPVPAALPTAGARDCRTSYDFELRITHL